MTNPIALFDHLRQTYLRYLESPFDLRYEPLVAERRALLDCDRRLYRDPLIEPVPPFASSGRTFAAAASEILSSSWHPQLIGDLTVFVEQGLFPPGRELYSHQFDAFRAAVAAGEDVIATSGTGSGKTECFLLPLAAALVQNPPAGAAPQRRRLPGTGGTIRPRREVAAAIIPALLSAPTRIHRSGRRRCVPSSCTHSTRLPRTS